MKKIGKWLLRIVIILLILVLLAVIIFLVQFIHDKKIQDVDQAAMVKSDEELIGQHLFIPRNGLSDVDVNYYAYDDGESHPLLINLHGGAFIAGDADTLDTQSDRLSQTGHVHVATVNYTLGISREARQFAIDEIADTVKYLVNHAEEYHIDANHVYIMGYSAGGAYAMDVTMTLHKENIPISGHIMCYAFLDDALERYNKLSADKQETMPPALFILAGNEPIGGSSLQYEETLRENGIDTEVKVYEDVKHGFIEENNPEYEQLHEKNRASKSPEAEVYARDAEQVVLDWMAHH